MSKLFSSILIGIFVVISYDVIGSVLSRSLGFNYGLLGIGSLVIYGTVGFAAAKEKLVAGILAATVVGLVDATIGWYLSWMIEPVTSIEEVTIFTIAFTIPIVITFAAVAGTIGSFIRRSLRSK